MENLSVDVTKIRFFKSHLNRQILYETLCKKPKVLIIYCHGEFMQKYDKEAPQSEKYPCFWFEKEELPSLVQEVKLEELNELLAPVKLIILSACHSRGLATKFIKSGVERVVSINSTREVLEKAAQDFNSVFLKWLFEGHPVDYAFKAAKQALRGRYQTCCCDHEHENNCLWKKYQLKNNLDKEAAHELHSKTYKCKCQFKGHNEQCNEAKRKISGIEDHPCDCPIISPIIHKSDCIDLKNFHHKLKTVDQEQNPEESKEQIGIQLKEVFPQQNFMCCCQPNLKHDETDKFIITPENQNDSQAIFDPNEISNRLATKNSKQTEVEKLQWIGGANDELVLFGRNLDVHQIVDFIFDKNLNFLAKTNHNQQVVGVIISQAVLFSLERHSLIKSNRFYKVDLDATTEISKVVNKMNEQLIFSNTKSFAKNFIKDLMYDPEDQLFYLEKCEMMNDPIARKEFLQFLEQIVEMQSNIKIIIGAQTLPDSDKPKRMNKILDLKELSIEQKYKFFKQQIKKKDNLNKQQSKELNDLSKNKIFEKLSLEDLKLIGSIFYSDDGKKTIITYINEYVEDRQKQIEKTKSVDDELYQWQIQLKGIKSIADKNIVLLLSLFPGGLTEFEIGKMCDKHPNWFGEVDNLAIKKLNLLEQEQKQTFTSGIPVRIIQLKDVNLNVFKLNVAFDRSVLLRYFQVTPQLQECDEFQLTFDTRKFFVEAVNLIHNSASRLLKNVLEHKRVFGIEDYTLLKLHLDSQILTEKAGKQSDEPLNEQTDRFFSYMRDNFEYFLDKNLLNTFLTIFKESQQSLIKRQFQELCLIAPSILIELYPDSLNVAEGLIKSCIKQKDDTDFIPYIEQELILLSIHVKQTCTVDLSQCQGLFDRIEEARKHLGASKRFRSEAETYFLEALLRLRQYITQELILSDEEKTSLSSFVNSTFKTSFKLFEKTFQASQPEESIASTALFGQAKVLIERIIFNSKLKSQLSDVQIEDYFKDAQRAQELFNQTKTPQYEVISICLQAQLLTRKAVMSDESIKKQQNLQQAKEIYKKAENMVVGQKIQNYTTCDKLHQTRDLVFEENEDAFGPPVVILQSNPLVRFEEGSMNLPKPIPSSKVDWLAFSKQISDYLKSRGYQGMLKFEYLTEVALKKVAQIGAKILHLTSSCYDPDYLFLEDYFTGHQIKLIWDDIFTSVEKLAQYGSKREKCDLSEGSVDIGDLGDQEPNLQNKISNLQLITKSSFSNMDGDSFESEDSFPPINCVVLAIPQSNKLGQKFKKLGVEHVVTFQDNKPNIYTDEVKYEIIQKFCTEFYQRLIDQSSVIQAFKHAASYGTQYPDFIPQLIDSENQSHSERLFTSKDYRFNTTLNEDQGQVLHSISNESCLNINLKVPESRNSVSKSFLYYILSEMMNQNKQKPHFFHLHMSEIEVVRNLWQELAYHMLERGKIKQRIFYKNMGEIKTQQQLKCMLFDLQRSESSPSSSSILQLIIFDAIDQLPIHLLKGFEIRLLELVETNQDSRFFTSSLGLFEPRCWSQLKEINMQQEDFGIKISVFCAKSMLKSVKIFDLNSAKGNQTQISVPQNGGEINTDLLGQKQVQLKLIEVEKLNLHELSTKRLKSDAKLIHDLKGPFKIQLKLLKKSSQDIANTLDDLINQQNPVDSLWKPFIDSISKSLEFEEFIQKGEHFCHFTFQSHQETLSFFDFVSNEQTTMRGKTQNYELSVEILFTPIQLQNITSLKDKPEPKDPVDKKSKLQTSDQKIQPELEDHVILDPANLKKPDDLTSWMICLICRNFPYNATQCSVESCNTLYCGQCLRKYQIIAGKDSCPKKCSEGKKFTGVKVNRVVKNMLESLEFVCPNPQCGLTFCYKDAYQHKQCQKQPQKIQRVEESKQIQAPIPIHKFKDEEADGNQQQSAFKTFIDLCNNRIIIVKDKRLRGEVIGIFRQWFPLQPFKPYEENRKQVVWYDEFIPQPNHTQVFWHQWSNVDDTVNQILNAVSQGRQYIISTGVTMKNWSKNEKKIIDFVLECRNSKVAHFFVLIEQPIKSNDSQTRNFINIVFHPGSQNVTQGLVWPPRKPEESLRGGLRGRGGRGGREGMFGK